MGYTQLRPCRVEHNLLLQTTSRVNNVLMKNALEQFLWIAFLRTGGGHEEVNLHRADRRHPFCQSLDLVARHRRLASIIAAKHPGSLAAVQSCGKFKKSSPSIVL